MPGGRIKCSSESDKILHISLQNTRKYNVAITWTRNAAPGASDHDVSATRHNTTMFRVKFPILVMDLSGRKGKSDNSAFFRTWMINQFNQALDRMLLHGEWCSWNCLLRVHFIVSFIDVRDSFSQGLCLTELITRANKYIKPVVRTSFF